MILAIFQDFKNCNVVKIRNGNKDKYGEIFALAKEAEFFQLAINFIETSTTVNNVIMEACIKIFVRISRSVIIKLLKSKVERTNISLFLLSKSFICIFILSLSGIRIEIKESFKNKRERRKIRPIKENIDFESIGVDLRS